MKIPMQAKRRHVYAGHDIKAGQIYEVQSENNARFLEQVGHAQRYIPPAPTYGTRAMTAAPAAPAPASTETRKPRAARKPRMSDKV